MFRLGFTMVVLFALLSGSVMAQGPPPAVTDRARDYSPQAWKELRSAEGRFTVSLPGSPTASSRTMNSAILGPITTHSFELATAMAHYYVSYADIPKGPTTPEEIREGLDASRDQALAEGQLILERDVLLDGSVGRELLAQNGNLILRARLFYIKGRLYQVIVATTANVAFRTGKASANPADRTDLFEKNSTRFLDSFKLIN